MKVAMLTYSLRPRGGVVHAFCLAEALRRKGVDVHLFSLRRCGDEDAVQRLIPRISFPISLFEFDWNDNVRDRLRAMTDAFMTGLPRDFDIYHAQDCVCDTALQLLVGEEAIAPPTVRTVHHIEGFQDAYLRRCELAALFEPTEKITVSKYWKEELRLGFNLESTLIHNGIDARKFEPRGLPREPFILFVGGMESRKGLEFAIEALEVLAKKKPEIRLIAIARPGFKGLESRAWFHHLIDRCGLTGRVELHELISDDALLKLYHTASVFLLPTRMEGWGLAIMEAMAAGCPVISSPVGGVSELVVGGQNGLLVSVGDVAGLAEAIERLLDDKELSRRLSASALETVKKYSWEAAAEKTIELYNRIISGRQI